MRNAIIATLGLWVVLLFTAGCKKTDDAKPATNAAVNVLFVGNSFTFYNDGIDLHLQKLLDAGDTANTYHLEKVAVSSYTLKSHYNDTTSVNKIRSKAWDIVVLQEQSTRPITDESLFLEYARKLDDIIHVRSKQTVLFMTWAYKDSASMFKPLSDAYIRVSDSIGAGLSPAGRAWEYSLKKNPSISMYQPDGMHPLITGTYYNACIFYIVLFGKNPVGNTYVPSGIDAATAKILQQNAWDFMLTWK